jgi:hypothetical protein
MTEIGTPALDMEMVTMEMVGNGDRFIFRFNAHYASIAIPLLSEKQPFQIVLVSE